MTSIDVIDDHTVRLNLSSWDNLILRDLGFANSCFLISPTAFEKNGEKWSNTHPVGTGPFKFKAFKRNFHLKYERFDDYWESGLPYLDGVEVVNIRDQMTSLASLKVREVNALNEIDIVTASELAASGKYEISGISGLRIFIVANANNPNSVWSDNRMREALEYAIDKAAIAKKVGRGYSKALYSIIPGVPGKTVTSPRKYSPEKAKQLMQEAGHPQGVECTLSFFAEGQRAFWVALQENLSDVGIKVKLNPLNRPALMSIMFHGVKGNDLRMGVMEDHPDPFLVLESHISPKSVLYKELKRPPELMQLIDQVTVEKDADKQMELFKRMENITYKSVSYIPLWSEPFMRAFDKSLNDYVPYFHETNELRLHRAWFDKK